MKNGLKRSLSLLLCLIMLASDAGCIGHVHAEEDGEIPGQTTEVVQENLEGDFSNALSSNENTCAHMWIDYSTVGGWAEWQMVDEQQHVRSRSVFEGKVCLLCMATEKLEVTLEEDIVAHQMNEKGTCVDCGYVQHTDVSFGSMIQEITSQKPETTEKPNTNKGVVEEDETFFVFEETLTIKNTASSVPNNGLQTEELLFAGGENRSALQYNNLNAGNDEEVLEEETVSEKSYNELVDGSLESIPSIRHIDDDWYYVALPDGEEGYIHKSYLQPERPDTSSESVEDTLTEDMENISENSFRVDFSEEPSPTPQPMEEYITMSVGYRGPEVAKLKQRMYELGYFKTNTVNNNYTEATAEYVKEFQRANGLPVTGVATPEMQALFYSEQAIRKSSGVSSAQEQYSTKFNYTDLARYPEKYKGMKYKITGWVAQVIGSRDKGYQLRLATKGKYDNIVYLFIDKDPGFGILEDDKLIVYAEISDPVTYEAVLGNEITIPGLISHSVELAN